MTTDSRDEPPRCPDCGAPIPERDPLVGWWLCDDCLLALDDDGTQIA
ncbi:hypothetical protein [Natrinema altunense]|uniref:Transcription factor zinc-finger domain-containing protein n=1 Tax=Natrinema altunense (strain JCM 12890 / CGMCC 1.3731 / AJ2) TaxID=1227494 RepID=L9ZHY6_NATA2|nr:hypothetical protein [Natrinema altunense]ELY85969.1 hypothetical protein C485_12228 [Natrinema altunense JCM 12890]